ncbi:NAD binding domain of 6-phosphogluconate dehydrogenase-domain-containing protein [Radiomyces spectabilis]|uniref:NAD binding domain of 6-phosphogluconate dehydrogenase-domain-containing protein n=1 Tax=Radiomyces spectabilis TaxID=64574 RepID=UPI00221FCBA8|nr:NAD binding domain of 6-phosphogluconate dehydrogenase-domain-containing protein [Radiomyces spectabilis]KAI8377422.1 NAD binding domain of 6-phosphogluconate dehydrogenase-domain-containing protein [Radiomyces spectabilis]
MQIAYVGLGAMGFAMAGHIADRLKYDGQPPLLAYNRTKARAEQLKEKHPVQVVDSLAQVAQADIIFTCLLNDKAVQEVVQGLLDQGLKQNTILVEQSTIDPVLAQELASKVANVGAHYMACPIMGPPLKAQAADLTILMAGPIPQRSAIKPLLVNVIGKKLIELGEPVEEAVKLKLCGNFFITSVIEMLAEGLTLGEKSGAGQDKVVELLHCVFPGTLLGAYADRMLKNTYNSEVHFPITSAKKDVNHILHLARSSNVDLPITDLMLQHLDEAQAVKGDVDLSAVVGALRQHAGLDFDLNKP